MSSISPSNTLISTVHHLFQHACLDWPQQDSLNRVQLDLLEAFQVVIMDTGSRKTLISVLLIKETGQAIRSTGVKKLIVFLAPTGHPVNEIAAYGSKGVDTWNLKSWQKEISDNDVLVLDVAVNGGTKVSDKEFVVTTELLMRKLLKVDGIKAEGDARLQRKAEIVHSIALFRVDFAGRGELAERQIIPTTSTNNTRLSQGRQLI